MKELRTIYPYGLNERAQGNDHDSPVGKLYPPITRTGARSLRNRGNRNDHVEHSSFQSFFLFLKNVLTSDLPNAYYKIRSYLARLKKKTLKKIAGEIYNKGTLITLNSFTEHYYLYILDIIDTKLYIPRKAEKRSCFPLLSVILIINI